METNNTIKKISFWSAIFVIVIASFGVFYIYYSVSSITPSIEETPDVSLDTKSYEELSKPKEYGTAISTQEAGYGRENPFAPIK